MVKCWNRSIITLNYEGNLLLNPRGGSLTPGAYKIKNYQKFLKSLKKIVQKV